MPEWESQGDCSSLQANLGECRVRGLLELLAKTLLTSVRRSPYCHLWLRFQLLLVGGFGDQDS